jgi:hypothetical protein
MAYFSILDEVRRVDMALEQQRILHVSALAYRFEAVDSMNSPPVFG